MASKAMPYIDISDHAVDRASQCCLDLWEETALPGEGLLTWLRRAAREALALAAGGEPPEKGLCHLGLRLVIKRADSSSFNLVTVINEDPSFPGYAPDPALGRAFLDWAAAGLQTGQLDCAEGAAVERVSGGILLRYPGLFRAYGQLCGSGTKQVKDSFLLLGLHVLDARGEPLHRLAFRNKRWPPVCGIIVRDAALLLGEGPPPGREPQTVGRPGGAESQPGSPPPEPAGLHLTVSLDTGGRLTLRKDGQAVHGVPEAWLDTIYRDGPEPAAIEEGQAPPAHSCEPPQAGRAAAPGKAFLDWLVAGVAAGRIPCNQPWARVHGVPEGVLLVAPGILQDYAKSTGSADFEAVQRSFLKLGLHERTPEGLNFHRYEFNGRGGHVNGLLLPGPAGVFGDGAAPAPNPWLEKAGCAEPAGRAKPRATPETGRLPCV